jgi:hypothetical protein
MTYSLDGHSPHGLSSGLAMLTAYSFPQQISVHVPGTFSGKTIGFSNIHALFFAHNSYYKLV